MANNKKSPLISSEELNQNLAPYAKRFLECHKSDGLGILDKGAIAAEVHREADEVNLLSELDTWFPKMADMKKSTAMNYFALHQFWTIDRPGVAEELPARYFTKKGISKLIYACRLERAREKAVKNGKAKNLGRYRGLDISTAGIKCILADPDDRIDILVNPVKELESIMKRPKPVSRKKPIVADDPSISDLKSVKSASKAVLQGMVTKLLTDLDSANAEKEQLRRERDEALLVLRQDKGSGDAVVIELQTSDIENDDMPTLLPDAVDDPGSKVLEVAEETVDAVDVESTVDEAVVEAVEPDDADDTDDTDDADVEAVDAERSGKDLEDRSSLDFEIDGNSDRLDDSYFEIAKKLVVAEALETETDVKVKKVRSARNIAPSIGAHGNMPYAGGAF